MSDWNDTVIAQFHAGDARVANMFDLDSLLVLHTVGAKSGAPRVHPLVHFVDGERLLIVASAAGADRHPAWFHNVQAHPKVTVERGQDGALQTFAALATPLEGRERDEVFAGIAAQSPGFGGYQEKTSRVIPVVALTRLTD